ncbi:Protein of unknown function [Gryllus bimaculatus]|nr:Protein of unknown function [Gryllus bimaculatus]
MSAAYYIFHRAEHVDAVSYWIADNILRQYILNAPNIINIVFVFEVHTAALPVIYALHLVIGEKKTYSEYSIRNAFCAVGYVCASTAQ